ncbi:hypothetical protein [Streptomyces poriferorum]|uniref:Transposase n=1 Tax=Streptomyces poriferorum TaxID=2798799 RepID=A0ABY9IY34_9ACTN|nr:MULTISPECIES: hypothetical protein [unclassified Streptomyces]MDP5310438.1 hypothetical protein [Streptomyces sp. Alt4]WLQ60408.1 hypothetical protein P8A19_35515 [Streptomyces sp. Alt2]
MNDCDPLWLPDELATTVPRMRRIPVDYSRPATRGVTRHDMHKKRRRRRVRTVPTGRYL